MEVIAATCFATKGTQSKTFEWKRHGLKLSIPEGALPSDEAEGAIDIKAGFAGQFQLPENAQLVSPMYWLCCRHKFQHPVTLEIQQCAVVRNRSSLCFVASKCSQKGLPYKFKVLSNGTFSQLSLYGTIALK